MDKFFESYRKKAEEVRDLPFKESDWNLLEKKMDLKERVPIPFIFWSFLIGLSLAALLFFLRRGALPAWDVQPIAIQDSNHVKLGKSTPDTIYIEKPIYITKVVTKHIDSKSSLVKETNGDIAETQTHPTEVIVALNLKNQSLQRFIDQQTEYIKTLKESMAQNTDLATKHDTVEVAIERALPEKLSGSINTTFKSPSPKEMEIPIAVSLPLASDTMGPWRKFLQFIQPVGLDWGFQGGVPLLMNQRLKNRPGFLISSKTSLSTKGGLELQAGISLIKLYYESSTMDIRLGVPILNTPKNDFKFYKAEALVPSISFDVALLYNLSYHKRLSPKVGLGIGYLVPMSSKIGYDFISINSPEEYPVDFKYKPKVSNPYALQWHGALDYALTPRWALSAQTTLYQKLRKDDFLSSRIDIGAGLKYRLF